MATITAEFLFKSQYCNMLQSLPSPYSGWDPQCPDGKLLNTYIFNGLLNYCKGPLSDIGLVRIGKGAYASQWNMPDGSSLIAYASKSGELQAAYVSPGGTYRPLDTLGQRTDRQNLSSVMLLYVFIAADIIEEKGITSVPNIMNCLASVSTDYDANGEITIDTPVREISSTVEDMLLSGAIPCRISAGNIRKLKQERLDNGELCGTVLCGSPDMLSIAQTSSSGFITVGSLRKNPQISDFIRRYCSSWEDWEREKIPVFPDDFDVPPEVVDVIRSFVSCIDSPEPVVQVLWRGITAYGKSFGVRIMASVLNMPLVWYTCHVGTELNDFTSKFVPVSGSSGYVPELSPEDICFVPEDAWKTLTGTEKPGVAPDEVLKEYVRRKTEAEGDARYSMVEADYITALRRGWIIEIQEISRIKDPGVLVGLNNFDRPGSEIPLIDGSHVKRAKTAFAFFTDNVGYASCRPVDPSVLRRMGYIIDTTEMPKERVLARVRKNVQSISADLLDRMYDVWKSIQEYCRKNEITEGDISVTELERWCQMTLIFGRARIEETLDRCVIAKASSNPDEQREIASSVELKLKSLQEAS